MCYVRLQPRSGLRWPVSGQDAEAVSSAASASAYRQGMVRRSGGVVKLSGRAVKSQSAAEILPCTDEKSCAAKSGSDKFRRSHSSSTLRSSSNPVTRQGPCWRYPLSQGRKRGGPSRLQLAENYLPNLPKVSPPSNQPTAAPIDQSQPDPRDRKEKAANPGEKCTVGKAESHYKHTDC